MNHIFIDVAGVYQRDEFENSHGILFNYLYDIFKERIISINTNFRKWRNETNNNNNKAINVNNYFLFYLIFYYRTIFGNII